jgi:ribosomal protein S18 acetylase RimI-like enzyme
VNIPEDLEISLGLPDRFRTEAAVMFYEAFGEKNQPLFGSKQTAIAIFDKAIDPELGMVAISQDRLVGLAGLRYDDRSFLRFHLSVFIQEMGFLKGMFGFFLFILFNHRVQQGELFLEVLIVNVESRSKGIGTLMLQEIFEFARQNQFHEIKLDVAAINPNARRLYERMGFACLKTRNYPFLRQIIGATAIDSMQKLMS